MNTYSKLFTLILLSVSLWGCSSQNKNQIPVQIRKLKNLTVIPANAKPVDQISFKRDVVYGSSKKVLMGRMGGIAVDDSGRVFIVDLQENTIHVFEPDG